MYSALRALAAVYLLAGTDPAALLPDDTPVRLPWPDVAALLAKARPPQASPPPQAFALGEARAQGELAGRNLSLRLELPVFLFDDDWSAIPLWRAAVTVRRATLDGKAAAFATDGDVLVLVAKGRGEHVLSAELAIAPGATGSQLAFPFATPVAASWHLTLPGSDARIEPSIRQSAVASAGRVTLDALTPPAAAVQLDWSGERGTAVPARLSAESLTFVTFQEGTTSGKARFSFEIAGGHREKLSLRLPSELEVLSAEASELAGWTVESTGEDKRLVARFRRPQRGHVQLDLSFELPKPGETATLPRLSAEDVTEQRDYVAASAESPLSMEAGEVSGGEAIDAKRLPRNLLRGITAPLTLAYRHDGAKFQAKVRIDRHATVALAQATIDAAYFTTVLTDEGEEVVKATFLVKNNLRPYLGVTLPKDATLWAAFVSGDSVNPASEGGKLLLPLVKSREVGEGDTLAVHTMQSGWSLSDVALQYYHDASKWKLIQLENNAVLGGGTTAQVGQALKIPRLMGPGGADLETAFPVEIVYSRPAGAPGSLGSATFEGPVADLDVMKVVWTVYLPSRLDPLQFTGNLTQSSYVRYGVFRRLKQLVYGPMAVITPGLISPAFAGSEFSLRKRFASKEEIAIGPMSHPREVLPLVGRGYVFKRFLVEGEQPRIQAVYADRKLEAPLRWLAFLLGLAVSLSVARALARGDAAGIRRGALLGLAFVVLVLVGGHFVLGTHGRAALGLLFGAWAWLLLQLFGRQLTGGAASRALGQGIRLINAVAFGLVLATGMTPGTGFFAVLCALAGIWFLSRRSARPAAPVAAAVLLLMAGGAARAQELPPRSEVTVPFGKLKDLLDGKKAPKPPPRDYSLLGADYRAQISGESFEVTGGLELEIHGDAWVQVPLIPSDEALTRVSLDGKPFAASTPGGSSIAILHGAGHHRLELSFTAPIREAGVATLGLVPGVASRLQMHLPAPGLDPELTGALDVKVSGADVDALVPTTGTAELRWSAQPRAPKEPGQVEAELRMVARTLQIVSVDEHRTYALVRYRVQRGATNQFSIQLPDDVELLDVQGEGIDQHQVVSEGGKRVLSVTTVANVRDELELSFAYDWKAFQEGKPIPAFAVRGVRSETGTLGIEASQSMEVQLAAVEGAAAIDVRGAPELFQHTDKPILHAIRYLQQPYSVRLALVQHPEVELETATVDDAEYTTVVAQDGRAISQGHFKLRNSRRAFLAVNLPPASEIQSVLIGGAPAKPVRDSKGNLLLPLMRSSSSDREMQQFDVEVVYLTRLDPADHSAALRSVLPTVDLRISKVSWSLYLPPGSALRRRPQTEAASDSMQWATSPRAILATAGRAARGGAEAIATGGILPVRFNLPTHGEPERFYAHYLPAGAAPQFEVQYSDASSHPAWQGLLALAGLSAVLAVSWALFQRRKSRMA